MLGEPIAHEVAPAPERWKSEPVADGVTADERGHEQRARRSRHQAKRVRLVKGSEDGHRASYPGSGDQVIRENPANRGTEASAEVLVGPPGG